MQLRQLYLGMASLALAVVSGPVVAQATPGPTLESSVTLEHTLLQKVGYYDGDHGWWRRHHYRR